MACTTKGDRLRISVDLNHARCEAKRVHHLLTTLRRRHDLTRFEYTKLVRIAPGSETFSHPILTLGNRFAESEDLLLSTYLHEQMHWYLWYLETPRYDPIAPFFDELVRRYPMAPIELPDGARSYQATYVHLVVNWLEIAATATFIGRHRALHLAERQHSYRWIYRTVVRDWDALGELYTHYGIVPIRTADELEAQKPPRQARAQRRRAKKSRSSALELISSIPP